MNFLAARFLARAFVTLACLGALLPAQAQNTMVRLHTTQGPIDFQLLDAEAPLTVANFLLYLRGGDYTDVFVHRNAWLNATTPFVIQAGGYKWPASGSCCPSVTSRGTVANEFSATLAMAKIGGDPNSATSQWFINTNNNAANLDNQNGGFTVFARVTLPGMVVADSISALQTVNATVSASLSFPNLPVVDWQGGSSIQRTNMVLITEARELPAPATSSDRIFNYLEAAYPQFLSPSNGTAGEAQGYMYRYYSASNAYVGTKDNKVWYLGPALGGGPNELGSVADWLGAAQGAGY